MWEGARRDQKLLTKSQMNKSQGKEQLRTVSGNVTGLLNWISIDLRISETPCPLCMAAAFADPPSSLPSNIIHRMRA
jgi:hypothetical protein